MIDFKAIAAACLSRADNLLGQWLPDGKRDGHEWKALNPMRGDGKIGSFSINLVTGAWADFATDDKGGDLVSLYAYLFTSGDQAKAARELAESLGMNTPPEGRKKRPPAKAALSTEADGVSGAESKQKTPWVPLLPAPHENAIPLAHVKRGLPEKVWHYRDAEGRLLGVVYRFRTSDGGKEVLPLCWARHADTGQEIWRWMAFPDPRPLYGLDRLAAKPESTLLIVEGEKCADVGHEQLAELASVSWPGGGKAVGKAGWQALADRPVKKAIIWPDCDAQLDKHTQELLPEAKQPGIMAARKIADILLAMDYKVWLVEIPKPGEKPSGWDIADAVADGFTGEKLAAYIKSNAHVYRGETAETAPPPSEAGAGQMEEGAAARPFIPELLFRKGDLASCLSNVYQILAHHPAWKGVLAYDEMALCTVKRKPPPFAEGRVGEWDAQDDSRAAMWLSRVYDFTPSSALVAEAVEVLARANAWHPVREYLRSLTWDGTPRLECWLNDFLGVALTPYSMRVGKWWVMGAVKRVLAPGAKFDYCLVLSGPQGKGKSTVFEVMGGEWYGDTELDLQSKDAMSALRGKMIYEFPELGALARSEERRQKSFLSRRVDEYRPVYGRREIKAPRQVIFGGSTNEHEWNKDPTGGRRFWPADCLFDVIDIAGLREVRDQLFAEALALVEAGERYWPTADEQRQYFDVEQLRVEQQDSLVDALHDWVYARVADFSAYDAAADCLKLDASKLTRDLQTRIGIALRKLGCTRVERRNGMIRYWYKPPVRNGAGSTSALPAQPSSEEDVHVPF